MTCDQTFNFSILQNLEIFILFYQIAYIDDFLLFISLLLFLISTSYLLFFLFHFNNGNLSINVKIITGQFIINKELVKYFHYIKFGEMDSPPDQQPNTNVKNQQKLHYFSNDKYHVFLHYKEGHPINLKQKFQLGHIRIFDESKMYYRELYSTNNLNTQLDWTQQYFNKIIQCFQKFQIKERRDIDDQTLDFIIKGDFEQKQNQLLLTSPLEQDFGKDIQKQFWKEFENYNNSKNQQIAEFQQLSKQNIKTNERKIQSIKRYYQFAQAEKKIMMGRLSAILAQKVNKLRQFEEDYNIQLFEDKLKKYKEAQQRNLSTYQEQEQMGAPVFQASQNFRQDF